MNKGTLPEQRCVIENNGYGFNKGGIGSNEKKKLLRRNGAFIAVVTDVTITIALDSKRAFLQIKSYCFEGKETRDIK